MWRVGGAGRHAEADAAAVVALGADAHAATPQQRRVQIEHAPILDEAAGREHHAAARADRALGAERFDDRAEDRAVGVAHQRDAAMVRGDARVAALHRREQREHQDRSGLVLHLRHVTARRRRRDVAERLRALGARPDESVVGGRLATGRSEDRLEGTPARRLS
jgi:hypothetical protein